MFLVKSDEKLVKKSNKNSGVLNRFICFNKHINVAKIFLKYFVNKKKSYVGRTFKILAGSVGLEPTS